MNEGVKCSYRILASLFGIILPALSRQITQFIKYGKEKRRNGRPPLLTSYQHAGLKEYITLGENSHTARTYGDIRRFLYDEFHKNVTKKTIHSYIDYQQDFKVVQGILLESVRAFVSSSQIDVYFVDLCEIFQFDIPSRFVANIDEVGFNNFDDARELRCGQ
ncbi:hypothetical protein TRFO_33275 [Tritrichomonas foetus]|uniref:Uncharacterized protein n=1 Tax=Tritrichomonas foetus TaxID=1144522 RepID=A0A1J4JM20_9EUKA|nr:hypothetical protein TRFO_33275 [Tritrichomonas foetus]|eukprot:OHT00143.1 hypothetical protein TRFO_33275 [Tritrichomonas foetus]